MPIKVKNPNQFDNFDEIPIKVKNPNQFNDFDE